MRKAYACLIFALIALAGAAPAAAKDEWLRADTHHFIIYNSNDDAKQLKEFAQDIERFDSLLRKYFNVPEEEHPNRLTIFILQRPSYVAKLEGQKNSSLAGFYMPSREGSFAVSNRDKTKYGEQTEAQNTLFHEYVHHLMDRYFTFAYPAWYQEGFAEYLATATFDEQGTWTLGRPAYGRAYNLIKKDMPIKDVLFGDPDLMDGDQADAYYGRAWLLVHMTANDPGRAVQLNKYLQEVGSGVSPEKAVADTFGDLRQLEQDLGTYKKRRLKYTTSPIPIAYANDIRITPLDEIDSRLAELNMQRRAGSTPESTRDALRQLAAEAPRRPGVLLELALAERDLAQAADKPDFTMAEAAADSCLAIDADNVRANVLKAELMMMRLTGTHSEESQWSEVRRYISRANHADPEDPLPLFAYAQSYAAEGSTPPKVATDALAKAFTLAPEASEIRVSYAYALAREGLFDQALSLVEFLAADPHHSSFGKQVVNRIRSMRDGVNYPAMPDTPDLSAEGG